MRFPWSKQNRDAADQDATNALLKELMEARQSRLSPKDALAELIKIGNRDVGIEEPPEAVAPKATSEASVVQKDQLETQVAASENPTAPVEPVSVQASATPEESLSGLSMDELVGLLGSSDSEQAKAS